MKIAEALLERKATKAKMESLKQRIYRNAQTQEGERPAEEPPDLLDELEREVEAFCDLVTQLNEANARTRLEDGTPLGAALIRKDMLHYLHFVCQNLADKATPAPDRYSKREIRAVAALDVAALRRRADGYGKAYRALDAALQAANWATELRAAPG
jgi:hypothetical protein